MGFSKVELTGNVTRAIELKHVGANSTPLAMFSVAINRSAKATGGRKETTYVECKAWGECAEAVAEQCGKGTYIQAFGFLKQETWEDKATGAKRSKLLVIVTEFTTRTRDKAEDAKPAKASAPAQDDDSEIPF